MTYGPSLLLDGLIAASAGVLARRLFGRRFSEQPAGRASRLIEPLAMLSMALTAAYLLVGQPRLRRWGATDEELIQPLPGDELVPLPAVESTWAVTIDAPADAVWPWLAQMGQDRGGFYSYAWLENLAGCQIRNAESIHPEWQHREINETLPLHPSAGMPVAVFEPGQALVLDGWGSFVLEPVDEQTTRLITRTRVPGGWTALSYAMLLEIPHFVMQRKMLLGIKQRAERSYASQTAARS
ncbi:MAG: hypothetical protein AB7P40_07910 [Chloroflexota bacterium]